MARDFEAYLKALLAFESGVDPDKWQAYRTGYDTAGAATYWKLERDSSNAVQPGHAVRTSTGDFTSEPLTFKQYFEALGVGAIVDPVLKAASTASEAETRAALTTASYAAMNMLGFVGYQIGEAALISAGYYTPVHHEGTAEEQYYYGGATSADFANGTKVKRVPLDPSDSEAPHVWATSINEWRGTFTGAEIGLTSLETFRTQKSQNYSIRGVMRYNLDAFCKAAIKAGHGTDDRSALAWALAKKWTGWQYKEGAETKHADVHVSMSGLLAGTHLVGPRGLVTAFEQAQPSVGDETGTSPLLYLMKFAGYSTPFDSPYAEAIGGVTDFDETVSAGWVGVVDPDHPSPNAGPSSDFVELRGVGHRTLALHREPGSKVEVYGFNTATDKVRIVGFPEVTATTSLTAKLEGTGSEQTLRLDIPTNPTQTVTLHAPKNAPTDPASPIDLTTFVTVGKIDELKSWYTKIGDAKTLTFDIAADVIVGPSGISFGQLYLQETKDGTRIRYAQTGGGVNTAATLAGVKPSQLSARNFSGFAGSFTAVHTMPALTGVRYVVDWVKSDRQEISFNLAADWFEPASGGESLSMITLTHVTSPKAGVLVTFNDRAGAHNEYLLVGLQVDDLKEHHFDGFDGKFSDIVKVH